MKKTPSRAGREGALFRSARGVGAVLAAEGSTCGRQGRPRPRTRPAPSGAKPSAAPASEGPKAEPSAASHQPVCWIAESIQRPAGACRTKVQISVAICRSVVLPSTTALVALSKVASSSEKRIATVA